MGLVLVLAMSWLPSLLTNAQASTMANPQVQLLSASWVQATVQGLVLPAREVELPYHWDRVHSNQSGHAVFELSFDLAQRAEQHYSLFFPLIGNAAEVRLNGRLLVRYGNLAARNWDDYSKVGRRVEVPEALLEPRNQLRILIRADGGRRAGLSAVYVGPTEALLAERASTVSAWRVSGSLFLGAFSLIVAFVALICWATQREPGPDGVLRRDSLYLYAGLAELCWSMRVLDALITHPPLPWPMWGVLMAAAYGGWVCGVLLFCHQAAGWRQHPSMKLMAAACSILFGAGVVLATASLYWHLPILLTAWLGAAMFSSLLYVVVFTVATVRCPTTERVVLAMAGVLNVMVGARDWVVIRLGSDLGVLTWNRYVSIFFGLALLYIVLRRFQFASDRERNLLATLQTRVTQREQELSSTYGRLEIVAREQARTHERERILRDMHDGVGAHISAAIRQLQSGQADPNEVLRTLRDSMDQLKLSIDVMQLPAGDVGALLAGLRYRLEPRFKGAGIRLEWEVQELPLCPRLDAAAMRQLQFLVFEAISNVLQHAQASTLRVDAVTQAERIVIRVVDDGLGFDAARVPQSLQARASALGAELRVQSQPGRTVIALFL